MLLGCIQCHDGSDNNTCCYLQKSQSPQEVQCGTVLRRGSSFRCSIKQRHAPIRWGLLPVLEPSSLDTSSAVSAVCPIRCASTYTWMYKMADIKLVSKLGNFDSYSDSCVRWRRLRKLFASPPRFSKYMYFLLQKLASTLKYKMFEKNYIKIIVTL